MNKNHFFAGLAVAVFSLTSVAHATEIMSCRDAASAPKGLQVGQPCKEEPDQVSQLLLEHPSLYRKIRRSLRLGQYPSIHETLVTILSDEQQEPTRRNKYFEWRTVREYQIAYYGLEYSDAVDSPRHVAIVTETHWGDGYSWESEVTTWITTCEKSPHLLVCKNSVNVRK